MSKDKVQSRQVNDMEQYIQALDEIMDIGENSELLYKEVLDYIEVHKGGVLDIWLKCIPSGIELENQDFWKTGIFQNRDFRNIFY